MSAHKPLPEQNKQDTMNINATTTTAKMMIDIRAAWPS